jgi:hypothetical protein
MPAELLPCPFCGGGATMFVGINGGYLVKCDSFCVEQLLQHERETSVFKWNRRAEIKESARQHPPTAPCQNNGVSRNHFSINAVTSA